MYYRNPQAIVFGLVFPLIIMVIFGLLNLGGSSKVDIGIVDQANNPASAAFIEHMKHVDAVSVHTGDRTAEVDALNAGKRDLVAVLPAGLGPNMPIAAYRNGARAAQAGVAQAILDQFAAQESFRTASITPTYVVKVDTLPGKNQTYTDFLVPGVIGMTVMQGGIFSIAFVVVRQKDNGVFRRLLATPMRKLNYLTAEVLTRLLIGIVQIGLLLAVATLALGFHLTGNALIVVVLASLASTVFISLGFVIAGVSKNEDSVPAIGNLVVLPMMFLSGVFFSVDSIPSWLRAISDRLPLTYLIDALRGISLDGKSVWEIGGDILGLTIWLVIAVVAAMKLFRWEGGTA